MTISLNKAIVSGFLGKDPEIRDLENGRVATLSVATSESWIDKQSGDRKTDTSWHRVEIYADGLVEIAEKYLKKGSRVYLEGQMRTRKWTDDKGVDRYTTSVVLQPFKGELMLLDAPPKEEPKPAQQRPQNYDRLAKNAR